MPRKLESDYTRECLGQCKCGPEYRGKGPSGCHDRHNGWVCTLITGHTGQHIACVTDGHVIDKWPNESAPDLGGEVFI